MRIQLLSQYLCNVNRLCHPLNGLLSIVTLNEMVTIFKTDYWLLPAKFINPYLKSQFWCSTLRSISMLVLWRPKIIVRLLLDYCFTGVQYLGHLQDSWKYYQPSRSHQVLYWLMLSSCGCIFCTSPVNSSPMNFVKHIFYVYMWNLFSLVNL